MIDDDINELAARTGAALKARGWSLVTAESCTGGWVATAVTAVAGSSEWFDRGFVTYSNASKIDQLGVPARLLERDGAVSEAVVRAMAEGALRHSGAHIAVAISGIAGPGGGSTDKPVGTVFIAWARRDGDGRVVRDRFPGDRQQVRRAAVVAALAGVLEQAEADEQ